jgi:hypothetical protein
VGRGHPNEKETEEFIVNLLKDRIIKRFGVPTNITTNNAKASISLDLV